MSLLQCLVLVKTLIISWKSHSNTLYASLLISKGAIKGAEASPLDKSKLRKKKNVTYQILLSCVIWPIYGLQSWLWHNFKTSHLSSFY